MGPICVGNGTTVVEDKVDLCRFLAIFFVFMLLLLFPVWKRLSPHLEQLTQGHDHNCHVFIKNKILNVLTLSLSIPATNTAVHVKVQPFKP